MFGFVELTVVTIIVFFCQILWLLFFGVQTLVAKLEFTKLRTWELIAKVHSTIIEQQQVLCV